MDQSPPSRRAREIFEDALDLDWPAGQEAHVRQACGEDAALARQVQALLKAHAAGESFLPGQPQSDLTVATTIEQPGDQIGRYKLLEKLGEGGFGVVYMAEQREPVRRKVALKIIKVGMDTREVVARFEAERQALALMDHPNIAKILDGGATGQSLPADGPSPVGRERVAEGRVRDSQGIGQSQISNLKSEIPAGRPYFVMELVRGIRITDFCDQNHLGLKERLELFMQVCQAVQHAHQKGIIHRDLKPSNILVTINDGMPVPKIIDFGIAKATQQELTEKTLFTAYGQFLGTPAYMSPEQTVLTSLDIDTRSDIYSLGVLLYELLTGKPPFDTQALLKVGLDELCRTLREVEPPRPSTHLSTLAGEALASIAKFRKTDAPKLVHHVRGDLDWIVMKCLEKDRARRYETANGLAADLQRHLSNEPVVARPPSVAYRFRKMVRRHRLAFAAAAAVVVALVAGAAVSTWQAVRATRAEGEQTRLRLNAEASQRAEAAERQRAQTEAKRSQQVTRFLQDMLNGVGPSVAMGRDTKMMEEILEKTAHRLDTALKEHPEVEAELRNTIGRLYLDLSDYAKAETIFRHELVLRRKLVGEEHREVAISLDDLGSALERQGKLSEAEAVKREALAMKKRLLGSEHPEVATSLNGLALVLESQGKLREAEVLLREVLKLRRKPGHENADLTGELNNLAMVLDGLGRPVEAEQIYRGTLETRRRLLGAVHPKVALSLTGLAKALMGQGRLAEAESLFREALAMKRKLFGDGHPEVATTLNDLASTLRKRQPLEAETLYREALAIYRVRVDKDPNTVATVLNNLGLVLKDLRKFDESEAALREALAVHRSMLGDQHPDVANALQNLAATLVLCHRTAEAEPLLSECVAIRKNVLGEKHPAVLRALGDLVFVCARRDELARAETLVREILSTERELYTNNPTKLAGRLHDLADVVYRQGRYADAEPFYREALANLTAGASTSAEAVMAIKANLARLLADWAWAEWRTQPAVVQRARESEQLLREVLSERSRGTNSNDWRTGELKTRLGFAVVVAAATDASRSTASRVTQFAEAESLLLEGQRRLEVSGSADVKSKRAACERLLRLYTAWDESTSNTDQAAKAAEWRRKLADFDQTITNSSPAGAEP